MRKLSLTEFIIIIALVGAFIFWIYMQFGYKSPEQEQFPMKSDEQIRSAEKVYERKIDSLKTEYRQLEKAFNALNEEHAKAVQQSQRTIKRLQNELNQINFSTYTNHELDSVIRVLYPSAELSTPDFDRTFSN